jgi:hypothetical protein
MTVLHSGNCERLKAGVHGVALLTAALCGAYNLSAWFIRRQPHLAVNAVLYSGVIVWEYQHVRHHIDARRHVQEEPAVAAGEYRGAA